MSIYFKIFKFIKPYKFFVFISLISSFLFVLMNIFSLWMISTLISTIMLVESNSKTSQITNGGFYHKLEDFAGYLIKYLFFWKNYIDEIENIIFNIHIFNYIIIK
ncbi:MAG: hypothetical protein CMF96_12965 [Candidatus Marinimicrobia bacterium]|nr:hypothetical protein [Candidatus Neomarinimicrobiota bacterium]